MKQEELRYKIDQLRKDKIIYATEATATALTCILGFLFANMFLEDPIKYVVSLLVLFVGGGYTLFMGIGNAFRLRDIKRWEKKLHA